MNLFKYIRKDKKTLLLLFSGIVTFIFIFIPFLRFEMVGVPHKINAYPSISALCGLVLGPIYGALAIGVSTLIYFFIKPKAFYFGLYSIMPPVLATISAGALSEGKWKYSILIFIVGLLIFYSTNVGRVAFYHPILTIFALLLVVICRDKISKLLFNKDFKKTLIGALILSFTSVMVDHLYGSILGILYLHLNAEDYIISIPEYIKERIVMTIVGAIFVILVLEISKCFLKNATKLKEELLRKYIDEEVKLGRKFNVDEKLLKKYNLKIPSEEEQKEILMNIVDIMVLKNNKKTKKG
ncbi:hypothetical protein [Methanocaldococcus sp.]|uniref:hypothetical protein n=1 Tax=Methanocaldococcus sp. TaxID=2152917 RepID=UPI0026275DF3|nr:hypothetical protein [Methanocaldococcus sp.]MCQ6254637.1 hypothetical protein [Methanocaldococcus sp.]